MDKKQHKKYINNKKKQKYKNITSRIGLMFSRKKKANKTIKIKEIQKI